MREPLGFGEDGLRRPDEERLDPSVPARARVRANGRASDTGSASRSSAGSRRAAGPSSATARISERVNELGGEPPTDRPGVLLRAERIAQDRRPGVGVLDRAGRGPDRGHVEPVPGQRPGLVGDDQVDRAEGSPRR